MGDWITEEEFKGQLPARFVTAALDDDNDGSADSGVLSAIVTDAENWIDGYLEAAGIEKPVTASLHPRLKHSALKYALYTLYDRRGMSEQAERIYKEWIGPAMKWLEALSTRKENLTPAQGAANASSTSIITETSKLHRTGGGNLA